jgi:Fe-S-cluster containining protein
VSKLWESSWILFARGLPELEPNSDNAPPRFECTRCGACCSARDLIVTLTGRDIARIAVGLGLDARQLLRAIDFYVSSNGETLPAGLQHTPQVMTEKGRAIIALKKSESGSCVFLDNNLCLIHSIRPGACRAFPFFFSDEGGTTAWGLSAMKSICPGLGKGKRVSSTELLETAEQILEEIAISKDFIGEWNESTTTHRSVDFVESILHDSRFFV